MLKKINLKNCKLKYLALNKMVYSEFSINEYKNSNEKEGKVRTIFQYKNSIMAGLCTIISLNYGKILKNLL